MKLSPEELQAIFLSLKVAGVATLFLIPVATFLAWLLARKSFAGKTLLDLAILAPLVMPPVVTGYLLLLLLGRKGPLGAALESCCNLIFAFRWTGAAVAAGVMALPLIVRPIRLALEAIPRHVEESAAGLGASPFTVFRTVTLPLALPGIVAGAVIAFAKALGEFGATITFVSNIPGETQTLPSAMYTFTQVPGGETQALRLALISIAISLLALLASEQLAKRLRLRMQGM